MDLIKNIKDLLIGDRSNTDQVSCLNNKKKLLPNFKIKIEEIINRMTFTTDYFVCDCICVAKIYLFQFLVNGFFTWRLVETENIIY